MRKNKKLLLTEGKLKVNFKEIDPDIPKGPPPPPGNPSQINWENIPDNNLLIFRQELSDMKNELVIVEMNYEVVRLKNLIEDDPFDYYWEVEEFNGKTKWITGVIGIVKLKGVIPDDVYNRMAKVWNLNHTEDSQITLINKKHERNKGNRSEND